MKSKFILISLLSVLGAGLVSAKPGGPQGERQAPSPEKMLERFDANEDGVIDLEEIQATFAEQKEKRAERGPRDQKGDSPKPAHKGKRDGKEKDPVRFTEIIIEKFDSDGDGALNQEELIEFFKATKDRRQGGPRDGGQCDNSGE